MAVAGDCGPSGPAVGMIAKQHGDVVDQGIKTPVRHKGTSGILRFEQLGSDHLIMALAKAQGHFGIEEAIAQVTIKMA